MPEEHDEMYYDLCDAEDERECSHCFCGSGMLGADCTHFLFHKLSDISITIAPILERTKNQIATHFEGCFEYHIGCLASRLRDIVEGER